MMRVCIVSIQLKTSSSGIGYYTRMLADGLAQRGHSVTLVVPESETPTGVTYGWQVVPFRYRGFRSHADWLGMAPQIARAVGQVCNHQNPALRTSMGLAARERVETYFSWPSIVERTLQVYNSVLARREM